MKSEELGTGRRNVKLCENDVGSRVCGVIGNLVGKVNGIPALCQLAEDLGNAGSFSTSVWN